MQYDSSFENIDNDFTKSMKERRVNPQRIVTERTMDSSNLPTTSSTAGSDRHLFSDSRGDLLSPADSDFDDEYYFRDVVKDFKANRDNFDQAIRHKNNQISHTNRYQHDDGEYGSTYKKGYPQHNYRVRDDNLPSQFQTLLNLNDDSQSTKFPNLPDHNQLKHPKSMADLKKQQPLYSGSLGIDQRQRLKNSMSYGNLRQPSKRNSVRFKRSMTGLNASSPIKEEIENNRDDTVIIEPLAPIENNEKFHKDSINTNNHNFTDEDYLNRFEEDFDDGAYNNSDDFLFDEEQIKLQYLNKSRNSRSSSEGLLHNDIGSNLHFTNRGNTRDERTDKYFNNQKNQSPTSKIRTIKQTIDYNTPLKKGDMFYNPQSMNWEGNQQVLDKFATANNVHRTKNSKIVGNMVLDEKQNRWVSLSGEEHDPFLHLDGEEKRDALNKTALGRSKSSQFAKKVTNNMQRYHSLNPHNTRPMSRLISDQSLHSVLNIKYVINSHTLEKFYHEENKWHKKVGGWFIPGGQSQPAKGNVSLTSKDNKDYMYEIRKMVLNSTRN